jgi:demethylmenaquinone methyltransferase/2-methoxy-6-polyprenyl-1,4-benzoquinol methylase
MQISPVTRSKDAARRAYDRLSGIYDLLAGSSETPLSKLGLQMLAIKKGEQVLEIGCGTGKALAWITEQVADEGYVHGLDLSTGMLHQAMRRLAKMGCAGRSVLLEGDGALLPYRGNSFNAIFLSFTLELFDTPEISCVLSECMRVLLPGGRLGVVAMHQPARPNRIIRLYEWFHKHYPAYADCRPIHAGDLVRNAGFTLEKQAIKSMWGLPVEILVARKP